MTATTLEPSRVPADRLAHGYRWEDEQGRVTHCTYQEVWFDRYQRAVKARSRRPAQD